MGSGPPSGLPAELAAALRGLERQYEIGRENDRGANGYLFFARNRITGHEVALKFYYIEPDGLQHREPQMLAQLRSPNVLEIRDAQVVGDEWAFFVTPRAEGGDLDDVIREGVSARTAVDIAAGICRGVSDIHAQGLVHRDLKPANIVMDRGVPKIADFGSVRLLPQGSDAVPASRHTELYLPPEAAAATRTYGKAGDVYQVGVIVYQLLGGRLPTRDAEFLNRQEARQYRDAPDDFDRQQIVNGAIRRRTAAGTLLRVDALPPWARSAAPTLRRLTAPNPAVRFQSISEAAVALHRLRSAIADWTAKPDGARLETPRRVIELRRVGDTDRYEAFVDAGGGFRRAPKCAAASLDELVAQYR